MHMNRISLVVGLLSLAIIGLSPSYSSLLAATYRCEDHSGSSPVLTDNPAQLHRCEMIQTDILPTPDPSVPPPLHSIETTNAHSGVHQASQDSSPLPREESFPGEEITIPLLKIGDALIVEVNLNQERSARLILDTGASMTVLSTDIALELGLLGTTDNELLTVNTAGGQVQVNINYLTSMQVGSAEATNVAVAIHDLPDLSPPIEGLLGMSFLKHFLVTLDAEHGHLILRPKRHS
jgi:clan AA aspartic protease (TIGR02281 family)